MNCNNCVLFKYSNEGQMTIRRQWEFKSPLRFVMSKPTPCFHVSEEYVSHTKQIFDRWTNVKGDVVFTKNCVQAQHIEGIAMDRKAREQCADTLKKDLEGAKVIVACGDIALEALGYGDRKVSKSVGWVDYNEELGASVLACKDPHEVDEAAGIFWKDFVFTLQRAEKILTGEAPDRNILPPLDWTDVRSLRKLKDIMSKIPDGDYVECDIETGGFNFWDEDQQILQLGLYHPSCGAVIVPPHVLILKEFGYWLEKFAATHRMVLQNSKFDSKFIETKSNIRFLMDVDTLWLHQMIDERTGKHGLEYLCLVYLNWEEYWLELKNYQTEKDRGYRDVPYKVLAQYLAYDLYATHLLRVKFMSKLRDDREKDLPWPVLLSQEQYVNNILVHVNNELALAEREGIRVDAAKVEALIAETEPRVERMKAEIEEALEEMSGEEVDINSPTQLLRCLKLSGILPLDATSVDKHTLEDFVDDFAIVKRILDYKKDFKVLSTYYKGTKEKMVQVGENDWRVFARFSIVGTIGSRWSSSNPNFQQSPREGPFKTIFIPRPGHLMFQNDYSGLEARCAAWLSGDEALAEACVGDLHQTVAEKAFSKFFDEVSQLDNFNELIDYANSHPMLLSTTDSIQKIIKDGKPFDDGIKRMKKHLRSCAKAITFGIFFGRGARALAEKELMCSVGEAQHFIDDYFLLFPKLHKWIMNVHRLVRDERVIIGPDGKIRDLTGWLFSPDLMTRKKDLARAERQAVNFLTQGLAGTINNIAFYKTGQYLRETGQGRVIGAVHDSTVGEILWHNQIQEMMYHLDQIKTIGESVLQVELIKFAQDSEIGYTLGDVKSKADFLKKIKGGAFRARLARAT